MRGPALSGAPSAAVGKAGSYLYMAPEVMLNEAYNEKVDIFSLGIIIFEVRPQDITLHSDGILVSLAGSLAPPHFRHRHPRGPVREVMAADGKIACCASA